MQDDIGHILVKRAERGSVRAAEQVFRKRELMPFLVQLQNQSSVARNFSTVSVAKDEESNSIWVGRGNNGQRGFRQMSENFIYLDLIKHSM